MCGNSQNKKRGRSASADGNPAAAASNVAAVILSGDVVLVALISDDSLVFDTVLT